MKNYKHYLVATYATYSVSVSQKLKDFSSLAHTVITIISNWKWDFKSLKDVKNHQRKKKNAQHEKIEEKNIALLIF